MTNLKLLLILFFSLPCSAFYSLEEEAYMGVFSQATEASDIAFQNWMEKERQSILQPFQIDYYENQVQALSQSLNTPYALSAAHTSLLDGITIETNNYGDPFYEAHQQILLGQEQMRRLQNASFPQDRIYKNSFSGVN